MNSPEDKPREPKPEFDVAKLREALNYWVPCSAHPDSAQCCLLSESDASALLWVLKEWARSSCQPVDRNAVLEEAAQRCDSYSKTGRAMDSDSHDKGYFLQALAAESCAVSIRALKSAVPESTPAGPTALVCALRARCPGNGDSAEPVECQSYEASEQGAPCPPGCCVMAEAKDVRSVLAAIEDEDAPASASAEPYGYVWFNKHMEQRFTKLLPHPKSGEQPLTGVVKVYAAPVSSIPPASPEVFYDKLDAARYRWLRSQGLHWFDWEFTTDTSDVGLDAAVDAALSASTPTDGSDR